MESMEDVRVALQVGVDTIGHGSEMDDEIIRWYQNKINVVLLPDLRRDHWATD